MTEEELKEKEEALKLKEKSLDDAIKAYMVARIQEEEMKDEYEEWINKMQKANFPSGVALGISVALLLLNLVELFV